MHGAQDVHERQAAGSRTVRQFPPDARSVRDARAFTRAVLHDEGVGAGAAERAVMIVSELAGNAVSHAGTAYSVGFERVDRRVRGRSRIATVTSRCCGGPVRPRTAPVVGAC